MQNSPVGIFDSGLGGLTVLKELVRELPGERFVYFGDTARVPYGTKSKETITRFSRENVDFLKTFDVKMIVVACHTASSLALDVMQAENDFPVIGMVECSAQKAIRMTKNRKVGIIATRSSIQSRVYETLIGRLAPKVEVISQPCPLFVSLVEEGWTKGQVVDKIVSTYLAPLKKRGVDTLVLGCTHYPVLTQAIAKYMGRKVHLVNPAVETANEAREILNKESGRSEGHRSFGENRIEYFVSDEPEQFRRLGERFLGKAIANVKNAQDRHPANR